MENFESFVLKSQLNLCFCVVSTLMVPLCLLPDTDQFWIGLHDTDMQMDFQWTDHTPVIFTYWHPFEPNNFRNTLEDCVSIWGVVSDPLPALIPRPPMSGALITSEYWTLAASEWPPLVCTEQLCSLFLFVSRLHVQEGRWDDSPCNLTLPSICKKLGTKSDGKPQHQACKQVILFSLSLCSCC